MSIRLDKEQLDEMIRTNPGITYTVMAGSGESMPDYGVANTKPSQKKTNGTANAAIESDNKNKKAKRKKYRNTRIYEYADGSISMNERRDTHMTIEEFQKLMHEENELEAQIDEIKTKVSILKKTANRKIDVRIGKLKEKIDTLKQANKPTAEKEKELKELETVHQAITDAQEKIQAYKNQIVDLKEKLRLVKERNEILKKGKEPETAVFDSKKEYQRWLELQMLQRAGAISDLARQVPYVLQPAFVYNDEKVLPIEYTADFEYKQNGKCVVEDVKGIDRKTQKAITTKDFKLKWKMLKYRYPDIEFRIY